MIGRMVNANIVPVRALRIRQATEIAAFKRSREAFGADLRRSGGFEANGDDLPEVYQWPPRRHI